MSYCLICLPRYLHPKVAPAAPPTNGKKSLALIFWAIANLVNDKRDKEFKYAMEYFGYEI